MSERREHAGQRTVHQLAHEIGEALTKQESWHIGGVARNSYEREYQEPPLKLLLPKNRRPVGSHFLAVYPPPFHETIRALIRALKKQPPAQGRLF